MDDLKAEHDFPIVYRCNEFNYHDVLMVLLNMCFSEFEGTRRFAVQNVLGLVCHYDWETLLERRSFVSSEDRVLAVRVLEDITEKDAIPLEDFGIMESLILPVVLDPAREFMDWEFVHRMPQEVEDTAEEAEAYLLRLEASLPAYKKGHYEYLISELGVHPARRERACGYIELAGHLAVPTLLRTFCDPTPSHELIETRPVQEKLSELIIICCDEGLQDSVVAVLKRECFRSNVYRSAAAVRLLIGLVLHQYWRHEIYSDLEKPLAKMPDQLYREIKEFFEETLRQTADTDDPLAIVLRTEIVIALEYWKQYGYELPEDLRYLEDTVDDYLPKALLRAKEHSKNRFP